ncbi:uncharacterized protein KD926_008050 [Aspergillus affinis]|uniref:uncharacterized protein n=1 Tax=Aspergillus affinis TaxID=1070780 RepID=UPI0022FE0CDD|nr:uncharacterized protein KD926_008050 [Aspergillus affinis]KAI9045634.1 hypothetical protein KD926_008050 [Aspergillus affinis]
MAALSQESPMAPTVSQIDDIITWEQFENAFERLSIKDHCGSGGSGASSPSNPTLIPQSEARNGPRSYHIEDVAHDANKPELRGRACSMPPPTIRVTPPTDPCEDECLSS